MLAPGGELLDPIHSQNMWNAELRMRRACVQLISVLLLRLIWC